MYEEYPQEYGLIRRFVVDKFLTVLKTVLSRVPLNYRITRKILQLGLRAVWTQKGFNPYSFRTLICDPIRGKFVRQELGETCADALIEIFNAGERLDSQALRSKRVRVGELIPAEKSDSVKVYHAARWGDSGLTDLFELNTDRSSGCRLSEKEINLRARKYNRYAEIFAYLRIQRQLRSDNPRHHWFGLWLRSFYVGKSIESVLEICNSNCDVMEFDLDADAWAIPFNQDLWQEAVHEIGKKFPSLNKYTDLNLTYEANDQHGRVFYHPFLFVIAEESNISLMDYGQNGYWFQILVPSIFRAIRLVQGRVPDVGRDECSDLHRNFQLEHGNLPQVQQT